jgi:hypothetical protein
MLQNAQPKGRTRATVKRSRGRAEAEIKRQVREACMLRDGICRITFGHILHKDVQIGLDRACCGYTGEWAHLGEKRRFKTRGMAPEERHTTAGSLMLCTEHHRMYDEYKTLEIRALSDLGADGRLEFRRT